MHGETVKIKQFVCTSARAQYVFIKPNKAAACKPDRQPSAPHHTDNLKTKAPNTTGSDHLYNTL